MKKQLVGSVKLQIKGGAATPAPPVGPTLGARGINIAEFCKQFNARTQDKLGQILPVIINIYSDKSFDFSIKTPPVSVQLLELVKASKGSSEPNRNKIGSVTWEQIKEIAENKMPDLNCFTLEAAMKIVEGTAKSMGITITGNKPF